MRQEELLAYIDRQEEAKLRVSWHVLSKFFKQNGHFWDFWYFVSIILPFFNQKKKFCWWDILLIKRDSTEEVVSQSTAVLKECCSHDVTLSLTTDFQCTLSKTNNYFRCVYIQNSIFASLLDASSVSFCCCGHLCLSLCLVCLRWLKNFSLHDLSLLLLSQCVPDQDFILTSSSGFGWSALCRWCCTIIFFLVCAGI